MKLNSVLAVALAFASLAAIAAPRYYISADIVRGQTGAQGTACVANTVFYPGEQIVWRAIVFDAASHEPLGVEEVKKLGIRVTVSLDNGTNLNMRLGLHPPDQKAPKRDLFWATNYPVAITAPLGTMKWTIAATDSEGNTGSYAPIGQEAGLNLLTIAKPAPGASPTASTTGPGLYGQYCASCHQANGQGAPGAFPSLVNSSVVTGDRAYLSQVVLSGLEGRISIKGQAFDGNMPAMGDVLGDAQIATILTYIRSTWNNSASPVGEDIVKAERSRAGNARETYARYPK